ncbi:MAG: hypothetical protein HYY51_02405 [Candidatus Magasanikbacteria bacterium]|nr:hypothetical protein [Candidatus Magasanikbacteria bacterium]
MNKTKIRILYFFIGFLLLAAPVFVSAVAIEWSNIQTEYEVKKSEATQFILYTTAGKDSVYWCEECGKLEYLSAEKDEEEGSLIITFDGNKVGGGVGGEMKLQVSAAHKDSQEEKIQTTLTIKLLPADSPEAGPAPEEASEDSEADPSGGYGGKLGPPPGYKGPLPPCVFDDTCRDADVFITLILNWGDNLFALIGSLAFVMFVYGGFMMIFSAGNAERVKKGQQILIAAVVGLIIAFSAYLLIRFVLDALDVSKAYRAIK